MRALRIPLFAIIAGLLVVVACSSKQDGPAQEPEPHLDAAVPDEPEPDAAVPDEPEPDAALPDEPEPDAALPDEPDEPDPVGSFVLTLAKDKLPILQGTSEKLVAKIARKNGFDEPIRISATGLPDGVSVAEVSVAAGADQATLLFKAQKTAPHSLPTAVAIRAVAASASDEQSLTATVYGAPGTLDTSFAGGKVVVPIGQADDYAHALAVDASGRIIVAGQSAENGGDFALLRLTRDGALDASFGVGGVVMTQVGTGSDIAYAVAVQDDGKILVAGSSDGETTGLDFALVRYEEDGSLDASFGDHGVVTTSFADDSDTAIALLIQADGKIVLGGESYQGATGVDFALARYNTDGSLDDGFGDAGKVVTAVTSASARDSIYALASMQVGGEEMIVAAGGEGDFKAARYRNDGSLDTGFGAAGTVQGMLGSSIGAARAVAVTDDGAILIAGHHTHAFALVRLTADGTPDASFGEAGKVVTPISNRPNEANGMSLESDGKIVVGGWVYADAGTNGNFALARYAQDGSLDADFGDAGTVVTEVSAPQRRDEAAAVLLQSDERVPAVRVILAGSASVASNSDFAVTRYWQ